jgi:hypothetical protein
LPQQHFVNAIDNRAQTHYSPAVMHEVSDICVFRRKIARLFLAASSGREALGVSSVSQRLRVLSAGSPVHRSLIDHPKLKRCQLRAVSSSTHTNGTLSGDGSLT